MYQVSQQLTAIVELMVYSVVQQVRELEGKRANSDAHSITSNNWGPQRYQGQKTIVIESQPITTMVGPLEAICQIGLPQVSLCRRTTYLMLEDKV